ncbi:MAG: hypothetical protein KBD78_10995 [Oligoflexales bacterium]|nr:hypothetical protein [Oligoflexales bacterium]
MSYTNFETKEIHCKVIFFGSPLAGKSANLQSIMHNLSEELKSGSYILESSTNKQPFFEFLPISMGEVEGYHLKLHLYTPPRLLEDSILRSVFLRGIDGYVFVADSSPEALMLNVENIKSTNSLLIEGGHNPAALPHVLQYNKRDLAEPMPISLLRQSLNSFRAPDIEAVATKSIGTMDCLELIAKQIIDRLMIPQAKQP